ncbi:MAG: hypothetical protein ABI743_12810 [bacterium]
MTACPKCHNEAQLWMGECPVCGYRALPVSGPPAVATFSIAAYERALGLMVEQLGLVMLWFIINMAIAIPVITAFSGASGFAVWEMIEHPTPLSIGVVLVFLWLGATVNLGVMRIIRAVVDGESPAIGRSIAWAFAHPRVVWLSFVVTLGTTLVALTCCLIPVAYGYRVVFECSLVDDQPEGVAFERANIQQGYWLTWLLFALMSIALSLPNQLTQKMQQFGPVVAMIGAGLSILTGLLGSTAEMVAYRSQFPREPEPPVVSIQPAG